MSTETLDISVGARLWYDGSAWTVVEHNGTAVVLRSNEHLKRVHAPSLIGLVESLDEPETKTADRDRQFQQVNQKKPAGSPTLVDCTTIGLRRLGAYGLGGPSDAHVHGTPHQRISKLTVPMSCPNCKTTRPRAAQVRRTRSSRDSASSATPKTSGLICRK